MRRTGKREGCAAKHCRPSSKYAAQCGLTASAFAHFHKTDGEIRPGQRIIRAQREHLTVAFRGIREPPIEEQGPREL